MYLQFVQKVISNAHLMLVHNKLLYSYKDMCFFCKNDTIKLFLTQ